MCRKLSTVNQQLSTNMLKIGFAPVYVLKLPEGHRFPISKYELLPEQLLYEGTATSENFFEPTPVSDSIIQLTHTPDYWHSLKHLTIGAKEMRKIGFPLTRQLIDRTATISGATLNCVEYAKLNGIAMNIAGGTHHAFTDRGEGFCLLNDVAIAANYLMHNKLANRILIIDLDVHQGNGTAQIFNSNDCGWNGTDGVFTFSMHGANNYPLHKEQSHLDIGLADKTTDGFYLKVLEENLSILIDTVQPNFAFFNSGVDILETDKLGKLGISTQGCKQRDKIVLEACKKNKIPLVVSMGGGYSPKISTILEAHANTFRMAQDIYF